MTEKDRMREKMRKENPAMTDEQFEAEWGQLVELGLEEPDEEDDEE